MGSVSTLNMGTVKNKITPEQGGRIARKVSRDRGSAYFISLPAQPKKAACGPACLLAIDALKTGYQGSGFFYGLHSGSVLIYLTPGYKTGFGSQYGGRGYHTGPAGGCFPIGFGGILPRRK